MLYTNIYWNALYIAYWKWKSQQYQVGFNCWIFAKAKVDVLYDV